MTRLLLLFSASLMTGSLFAQEHADCATALEICNKQPLHLYSNGEGVDPSELDSVTCYSTGGPPGPFEFNISWIRFTVSQGGSLWFIIRPDNTTDDLDFVVFRLSTGNCADKTVVRCMAAGDFVPSSPCMGPTGLLPGQTDINGPAGCPVGADNFLAPLETQTGEIYALAINNFTSSMDSFSIEFCGTALLGCETEVCGTLASNEQTALQTVKIYPNPAVQQETWVEWQLSKPAEITGTLFNMFGIPVRLNHWDAPAGPNRQHLNLEGLPAGVYILTLSDGNAVRSHILQVIN